MTKKEFVRSQIIALSVFGVFAFSIIMLMLPRHVAEEDKVNIWEKVEPKTYAENVEEIEVKEIAEEPQVVNPYLIEITDEEVALMARVVMSESSLLPQSGKQAVAQTIVNRVLSEDFVGNTVTDIVRTPFQYSTADNGEPTPECYQAVYDALTFVGFPETMYWFRTDYPHEFGYEYCTIGNTYFSTKENVKER